MYRYSEHVTQLAQDLELPALPAKDPTNDIQSTSLTPTHESIIQTYFKDDLDLYSQIIQPGIVLAPQGLVVNI